MDLGALCDAVLVVDAGITPSVGRAIIDEVRRLTDRPLRYLVNTTYHGDHTFGNSAFPADVRIVSSPLNALSMTDLDNEKRVRGRNMYGHHALHEVVTWRRPDTIVYDREPGVTDGMIGYLTQLDDEIRRAVTAGRSLDDILDARRPPPAPAPALERLNRDMDRDLERTKGLH
jgi:glyoxylase-like metal-dependent hydrolase (beta-lactamase superfamily II)